MKDAVAVDLGATSGRFAAGRLEDGAIHFDVVEQTPHAPIERGGRLEWDIDSLMGICRRAVDYAEAHFAEATVGIDSWGVDFGFLDENGGLLRTPICYRDLSHTRVFEEMRSLRHELWRLTGIQHHPFNTCYQLIARRLEDPLLAEAHWLLLPDLLMAMMGAAPGYEMTHASTTQLLGTNGKWSREAFHLIDCRVPDREPVLPGGVVGAVRPTVRFARVGHHDTASAVCGLGTLADDQAFLNVGTWSLLGCMVDNPIVTAEAELGGFSNERSVDGRIRFLTNIPGFYVINRLHDELGIKAPVPSWLASADLTFSGRVNLMEERFFNPQSMPQAVGRSLRVAPGSPEDWAGVALGSLAETTARQLEGLENVTGRRFASVRVAGGGSASGDFCKALADATHRVVLAGPVEATIVGNLALQFLATGAIADTDTVGEVALRSFAMRRFEPSIFDPS